MPEMPESILEMYERPGGPPGNGWRRVTSADIAASISQALTAAGYAIVPVEPTDKMRDAGAIQQFIHRQQNSAPNVTDALGTYRAMLKAAP